MKKIHFISLMLCSLFLITLSSCEKETADAKDKGLNPESAGYLKIKNVKNDPYLVTIKKAGSNTTDYKNKQIPKKSTIYLELHGDRTYEISYEQKSGYSIYPTKGSFEAYVSVGDSTTATYVEVPD